MTRVLATVVVIVVIVGGIAVAYLVSRRKARGIEPGVPDRVSAEVVTGLMAELRKWQAEAAHWKSTAERLQREIDNR
jgi:hypothetical protein